MKTPKEKKKLKLIFVTVILTFLFLVCYTTVTYAAPTVNSDKTVNLLDPFSLRTITFSSTRVGGTNYVITSPVIRITTRPVVRSCYRPPIVPR